MSAGTHISMPVTQSSCLSVCLPVCLLVNLFAVAHQGHVEQYSLSLLVGEDAPVGTLVGEVQGDTFAPPYSRWIFQATDNRTVAAFHVDLLHGRIFTKGSLDREQMDRHTIIINTSLLRAKLLIVDIRVLDVNDVTPMFLTPPVTANIPESAPMYHRIPLGDVRDEDLGENTTQKLQILSGNEDNDFTLEVRNSSSVDKMVELVVNYQLDFERTSVYRLVVQATDGGGRFSLLAVTINILDQNDNEPIFNMSKYSTRILENVAVGALVIQVYASDSDSGDNGRITYSIDSRSDPEAYFSMDARTGQVRLQKPLDYESHDRFSVTIQAEDNGIPAQLGTAALDIIVDSVAERTALLAVHFQPGFRSGHIPEDTPVGTLVAVVTVDGLDIALASGVNASLYNSQGYLALTSGNFLGLYVSSPLDREAVPDLHLILQCFGQGLLPIRAHTVFSLAIDDVNDNPPVFDRPEYVSYVEETAEVGSEVVRVAATDADAGANAQITYHIDRDSHSLGWFSIDPNTGIVRTSSTLDCNLSARSALVIVAKDGGAPALVATAQLTINIRDNKDQAPEFETSFYSITVAENRRVGDCILVVSATDLECGTSMPVVYRMAQMLAPPKEFRVDVESGAVCIHSELDFEATSAYQFQLEAVDTGGLSSQAVVQIEIADVNDNHPRFEPRDYPINVLSGVGPGQLVSVQARDRDSGRFGTVSYKITDGNDQEYFSIDSSTGAVSLTQPLPATEGVYSLRVQAMDGGGMTSPDPAVVTVSVISGAVQPPVFDPPMFNLSVSEDADLGHIVGHVRASLDDSGADMDLVYSSLFQTSDWFSIDSWTGSIYTRTRLDREQHPFVLISVQAQAGFPPVYATAQVNVTILDVNDNEPHFSATTMLELDVWEDQVTGTALYIARATDLDVGCNGSVRYQLYNNLNHTFTINEHTGEISLLQGLDFEQQQQHLLTVVAEDMGSPVQLRSNMTLRVKVKDVNDNTPVFDQAVYEFYLPENVPAGHPVGMVQATDHDCGHNKRLSYSIQKGHYDSVFGISAVDGTVWTQRVLDREVKDVYQFTVGVSDHGSPVQLWATAQVRVMVTDLNDNGPVFSRDEYRFHIRENLEPGTFVGQVVADDLDTGQNGHIHFFFSGPQTYFAINAQNGEIRTQISLDREVVAEHVVMVYASDMGDSPRAAVTRVKVIVADDNDNRPNFHRHGPQSIHVSENRAKGTAVISLEAVDLDEGDNARITYFFDQDESERSALANFQIHVRTGQISTREVLDHESQSVYHLVVVARDHGEAAQQTSLPLTISVLDTSDQATLHHSQHVRFDCVEDISMGTVVGQVKATQHGSIEDSDVVFYLVGGNVFSSFSIGQDSGVITTTGQLDYEKCSAHSLSVLAVHSSSTQSRNEYIKVSIKVTDINDNPPVFEQDPAVIRGIAENTPPGQVIYKFAATDLDSGVNGTVHYLLESCCGELGTGDLPLDIDIDTGELFVSGMLDFEMTDQISVIVKAQDACPIPGEVQHSKVTAIVYLTDVNDNTPEFTSPASVGVWEDEAVGAVILLVVAVDADAGMDGSDNNIVRYHIVSGNEDGKFELGVDTGYLAVSERLDYESRSHYTLNISAEDLGTPRLSTHQLLQIAVLDVNDNPPAFDQPTYHASVAENCRPHTAVIRILATDADTGNNGQLTYWIPPGGESDTFLVDPQLGVITTSTGPDREIQDTYNLTVFVKDGADPVHYGSCSVIITITDHNDNIPDFKNQQYTLKIPENRGQRSVLTLVAYDRDLGDNARIAYSITGGNDGKFSIDPDTGVLSSEPLDRELTSVYSLTITATDHGVDPHTATTSVAVTVLDDNDNDPVFTEMVYRTAMAEDTDNSTIIMTVTATDLDEDDNGHVTYSLGLATDSRFKINSVTGEIYTCGKFDRETRFRYTFLVVATDSGVSGSRNSTSQAVITVTDVNDNAPRFSQVPYKVSLGLFTPPKMYLLAVTASDSDIGNNGLVEYSLLGNSQIIQAFHIDRVTGGISTRSALFLVSGDYTLLVQAADSADYPATQLYSTGIVEITVGSEVSTQFEFFQPEYRVEVPEHSNRGHPVINVTRRLSGSDSPSASTVYSIVGGNDNEAFSIHAGTGLISVADPVPLDYETTQSIRLTVQAAASKHHTYATVWVNLTDINDNTPEFSQSSYVSAIWENNHSDTYVGQVLARDADSGPNGDILYSIIDGNRDMVFRLLRPSAGIVVTNGEAAPLDREAQPHGYRLTIEARDRGQPSKFSTCVLVVSILDENDTPPLFPEIPPANISESEDVGCTVTMVTANDVDLHSVLVYDFATDGNPGNTFGLDRSSGRLTLAKRVDYEKQSRYSVGIQVTDGKADHVRVAWLDVFITDDNDSPPIFSQPVYQVVLSEQTGAHHTVIMVTANDADSGHNAQITYSLAPTAGDLFHINPTTGLISTSREVTLRSDKSVVQLLVIAQDAGVEVRSSTAAVYVHVTAVNKFPPRFVQAEDYIAYVDESAEKGHPVLQVSAVDDDNDWGQHVSYSLLGPGSEMFFINPRTGGIVSNTGLDFEVRKQYDLTAVATDHGTPSRNVSVPVTIRLEDSNDNTPVFLEDHYSVFLDENAELSDVFLTVEASDADIGINAEVKYFIVSGNNRGIFLNPNNEGKLMIREGATLDYELQSTHHLIIKAVDCNDCPTTWPRLSAFVAVDVHLNDVNEFVPRFPIRHYTEKLAESCQVGTVVFVAHACDDDGGQMGVVTYSLRHELDYQMFAVDAVTGQVTTQVQFDYERDRASHVYNVVLVATDAGQQSDVTDVTLQILDVDEFDPQFTDLEYTFEVPGSAEVGDVVGQVSATDDDAGEAGKCVYSLLERHDYFSLNPQSGHISVATTLHGSPVLVRYSSNERAKRALTTDRVDLTVQVSSGQPGSRLSTARCVISINRTCSGCAAVLNEIHTPLDVDGGILAGIIVGCIIIIILTICGILCLVYQHKHSDVSIIGCREHSPAECQPPSHVAPIRSVPADFVRVNCSHSNGYVTSDVPDHSLKSASSDWDLDDVDDEDDDISQGSPSSFLHSTQIFCEKSWVDSEVHHQNDALIEHRLPGQQPHTSSLKFAFMKDGQWKHSVTDLLKDGQLKHSVTDNSLNNNINYCHKHGCVSHSFCLYENDGTGCLDDVDTQTLSDLNLQALSDLHLQALSDLQNQTNAATLPSRTQVMYLPGSGSHTWEHPYSQGSGSHTWEHPYSQDVNVDCHNLDGLINWNTKYQSLAQVFSDIAQLKDEALCANRQPLASQQQVSSLHHQPPSHHGCFWNDPAPTMLSIPWSTAPLSPAGRCSQSTGTHERCSQSTGTHERCSQSTGTHERCSQSTGTHERCSQSTGTHERCSQSTGTHERCSQSTGTHERCSQSTGTHERCSQSTGTHERCSQSTGTHERCSQSTGTHERCSQSTGTHERCSQSTGTHERCSQSTGTHERCSQSTGTQHKLPSSPVSDTTCVCGSHIQQPTSVVNKTCSYQHHHVPDQQQMPEFCDVVSPQDCQSTPDCMQHLTNNHIYATYHHLQNSPTPVTLHHLEHQHLEQQHLEHQHQHIQHQHLHHQHPEHQQHYRSLVGNHPHHHTSASPTTVPSTKASPAPQTAVDSWSGSTAPPTAVDSWSASPAPPTAVDSWSESSSNHYIPGNYMPTFY